jgi:hypothetical protein
MVCTYAKERGEEGGGDKERENETFVIQAHTHYMCVCVCVSQCVYMGWNLSHATEGYHVCVFFLFVCMHGCACRSMCVMKFCVCFLRQST